MLHLEPNHSQKTRLVIREDLERRILPSLLFAEKRQKISLFFQIDKPVKLQKVFGQTVYISVCQIDSNKECEKRQDRIGPTRLAKHAKIQFAILPKMKYAKCEYIIHSTYSFSSFATETEKYENLEPLKNLPFQRYQILKMYPVVNKEMYLTKQSILFLMKRVSKQITLFKKYSNAAFEFLNFGIFHQVLSY